MNYWEEARENGQRQVDYAERMLHYSPTNEQILANLKMHIELFDAVDVEAGIWAWNAVAKILYTDELQYRRVSSPQPLQPSSSLAESQ